ncbi:MAG TPA: translation initiation factor IF-2 [Thermoleophilia bacterium]|nr:translation initiation factor IF-2 [Thermoleophilia bacterium]HQG03195.1 translation initiation factor IF-2 [Thermoleophilia bacterium]HQG54766.1 translation initiation factor IF-2 [Thermoleophilia bacterium]
MAKRRKVSDIANQRGTSVDDVLAHLKRAGIEVVDGEVSVDEEAIERAYAAGSTGPRRPRPNPGGRRRRVIIDAGASRRGGPQTGGRQRRGRRNRSDRSDEQAAPPVVPTGVVKVPSGATVKDVSQLLGIPTSAIIKTLMGYGEMVTITQTLTDDAIEVLAGDFGREVEITHAADEEAELETEAVDDEADLEPRPAVVTVMGHVDHGKTSLLDAIRDTAVAAGEAGGITQHIGAYQVRHKGKLVTFIDTPGHAAFTAMRARGAKVTDIAAIVVAADDGVMPQTVEAIDHAKAAGVPMVIVVNKIDKPEANVERIKQQLTEYGIVPEEWGGDTVFVEVSAKKRIGIEEFLEMLLLVAEMADLKANPDAPASGFIIESRVDPGRGVVATMLVGRGTLHVGDAVVAGEASGRVRAMRDFRGEPLKAAGPSTPVEIVGFDSLPAAGELCRVVKDERTARSLAQKRANRIKSETLARQRSLTLDDVFARIAEGKVRELDLVVKADVQGSLEALTDALLKIQHPEVKVRIIHGGVGGINESDVMLAAASSAIVIGFNVRPSPAAQALAESEGVDVRTYRVIYKVTEDITAALVGMLKPEYEEVVLGQAEVRQLFRASKLGTIAGCMVTRGVMTRNANVRVLRNDVVVHDGKIASLRRFSDDVREAQEGFECGILLDGFNDIKEGDVLEAYETREVAREV